MDQLDTYFNIHITKDVMEASMELVSILPNDFEITEESLSKYLIKNKINYGINQAGIQEMITNLVPGHRVIVAKGLGPEQGEDGTVNFIKDPNNKEAADKKNFRDIMRIPSVQSKERFAYITDPTEGKNGVNVLGQPVLAKPGKPVKIRAGKNVEYSSLDKSFYALESGQLSITDRAIQVLPLYEVKEDLSLKTGNLDFVGSITIHGNVPTGYTVRADGDVKIFGMVEGAFIEAGGSIFIKEGIAGLKKGSIKAGLDIKVGYINQAATVEAGRDIFVENSILHSHCVAKEHIYCKNGNIIGGSLSAGMTIEAKDIGNKMNTKTELCFGVNKKVLEQEAELKSKKNELIETKKKLELIGEGLKVKEKSQNGLSTKERVLSLKQRHTMEKTLDQLQLVEEELSELQVLLGDYDGMKLIVKRILYTNVNLVFGKYSKVIQKPIQYSQARLIDREITIQPL